MADSFFQVLARRALKETSAADREEVFRALQGLTQALLHDPEIRQWIRSVEKTTQEAVFTKTLFQKLPPAALLVVQELFTASRLTEMGDWWKEYVRTLEQAHAGKEVRVTTVHPLTEKAQIAIQKNLEKRFDMPIFLTELLDPMLKGGIKFETEDWSFDASLKGRLTRLTQELIAS